MKKATLVMMGCLALLALGGCQNNEIVYPQPDPEVVQQYMTIDELCANGVDAPSSACNVTVRMVDEDKWTVYSSDTTWCAVSPKEGSAYTILTLRITANSSDEMRTARLTFDFTSLDVPLEVEVRQEASAPFMSFSQRALSFALGGDMLTAEMTTNASSWSAEVVDDAGVDADWCRVDQTSGGGSYTFNLTADPNDTGNTRTAQLKVTCASGTEIVTLQQAGTLENPQLALAKGDTFRLTWNDIDGEEKYELHIWDGPDKATANLIETITLSQGISSLDLSAYTYAGNYIGMVYFELNPYATIHSSRIDSYSNIVSGHNYFDDATADATGAVGSEFLITNRRHLDNVRLFLDKNFKQQADIDMTGYPFKPISSANDATGYTGDFTGSYDGNQYKISNLNITQPSLNNVALFAVVGRTGVVTNVKLEDPEISGALQVAGIAGSSSGTITSCTTTSTASGKGNITASQNASAALGGIVGWLTGGSVAYCTNNVSVKSVVGTNYGSMIGGIVGRNATDASGGSTVSIDHCINFGAIEGGTQIGGIVGEVNSGGTLPAGVPYLALTNSYNAGAVKADAGNSQCGGIIGRVFALTTVRQCYNKGMILTQGANATAAGSAGGIVGRIGQGTGLTIENCYNRGDVASVGTPAVAGNANAGGILAANFAATATTFVMKNCYNAGNVSASTYSNGLYSRRNDTATQPQLTMLNCVALDETGKRQTGDSDSDIVGPITDAVYKNMSATDMGIVTSYDDTWDFTSVWEMGTAGLPKLVGLPE